MKDPVDQMVTASKLTEGGQSAKLTGEEPRPVAVGFNKNQQDVIVNAPVVDPPQRQEALPYVHIAKGR